MLIPSHLQLEPSNSRTRVPAGGIDLIASIDFTSDGAIAATLSSSTKVSQGEDTISSAEVATPNHSNQQYSIYAITDAAANIAERYAYTAYGQPTILDAAATVIATSAINNRYTYTAREWDATVGLYHFRARWMSGVTGRFLTRDPMKYADGWNLYQYARGEATKFTDPNGTTCGEFWTACTTEPIDEKDIVGMSWHNVGLNGEPDPGDDPKLVTLGKTLANSRVSCPCIQCCDKWYIDHVSIHTKLIILLDKDAHKKANKPLRGSYGHEQLHVLNFMRGWKNVNCPQIFAAVNKGPFASQAACEQECSFVKRQHLRLDAKLKESEGHDPDDHEPYKYRPYEPLNGVFPEEPGKGIPQVWEPPKS